MKNTTTITTLSIHSVPSNNNSISELNTVRLTINNP